MKLEYKGIKFDSFVFEGKKLEDESNIKTLDNMEIGWTYICPHCIKKYALYNEVGVTEKEVEEMISDTQGDDFICGVDNCNIKNAMEISFYPNECELV